MGRGRDTQTMDLLAWEPESPVRRYEEGRVRAVSLRAKIARAVAETLLEYPESREHVAASMSEWMGEDMSKNMLDAYASEARDDHSISFVRLLALVHATGDTRPLQVAAEMFGCSVVEDRFLPWIEFGQLSEVSEELSKKRDAALRLAKKGPRR